MVRIYFNQDKIPFMYNEVPEAIEALAKWAYPGKYQMLYPEDWRLNKKDKPNSIMLLRPIFREYLEVECDDCYDKGYLISMLEDSNLLRL